MIKPLYCHACIKVGTLLCADRRYCPTKDLAIKSNLVACHSFQGIQGMCNRIDLEEIEQFSKTGKIHTLVLNETELEALYLLMENAKQMILDGEAMGEKSVLVAIASLSAQVRAMFVPILEARKKSIDIVKKQEVPTENPVRYVNPTGYLSKVRSRK